MDFYRPCEVRSNPGCAPDCFTRFRCFRNAREQDRGRFLASLLAFST
ncbi:MAG: hypothetical protein LBS88_06700 [Tannerellaceae bacterium]|nr:hypothetical protein [Tannerellaceae bacterium]